MDNININIKFSKTLRVLRKQKGLTQEKLAEMSDIDYKYLQKLESKTPSSPTLNVLEKIATALNMPLSEFIKHMEEIE